MIDYWDLIFIFEYIALNLILIIIIHALAVSVWSYMETGNPMIYLRNFYWNAYHIKI